MDDLPTASRTSAHTSTQIIRSLHYQSERISSSRRCHQHQLLSSNSVARTTSRPFLRTNAFSFSATPLHSHLKASPPRVSRSAALPFPGREILFKIPSIRTHGQHFLLLRCTPTCKDCTPSRRTKGRRRLPPTNVVLRTSSLYSRPLTERQTRQTLNSLPRTASTSTTTSSHSVIKTFSNGKSRTYSQWYSCQTHGSESFFLSISDL